MTDQLDDVRRRLAADYRVERELGRVGMAVVYLAVDLRHDRPVAIKVILPEIIPVLGADRFEREIQLAARLAHPRIVAVYASGDAGGLLYYVMPFVDGPTVRERLEQGPRVQSVLEGSVRVAGERIRVGVQLCNGTDGFQLWSQRFDGSLGDVFAIEDRIARAVVAARDRAAALLAELGAAAETGYVSPVLTAIGLLGTGELDRALDALEQAAHLKATDLVWLKIRPAFGP